MSVLIFGTLCDNYVFYSFSLNLIEFSHDVLIAFSLRSLFIVTFARQFTVHRPLQRNCLHVSYTVVGFYFINDLTSNIYKYIM